MNFLHMSFANTFVRFYGIVLLFVLLFDLLFVLLFVLLFDLLFVLLFDLLFVLLFDLLFVLLFFYTLLFDQIS